MIGNEELITNFLNKELNTIPNILNNELTNNNDKFNYRFDFNEIKTLINDFLDGNDINRFLVLPGLRGLGKTVLLYQTYEFLLKEKNISPNQILYFSCENLNNLLNCNLREVIDIYLKNIHNTTLRLINKPIFLLIDESQYDKNWSISGKIIFDSTHNIFMIFTGSSALNLEYNADAARRMIKHNINPLNYAEHLKLKYNIKLNNISKALKKLIFHGEIEESVKLEKEINNILINHPQYISNDWDEYLRYGGFPALFNEKIQERKSIKIVDMVEKIIDIDMVNIEDFKRENRANANRLIRFLAIQKAGDLSQNNLANFLKISSASVKNILDTLEKTHLIFHCEPYGGGSKRINKSWKYYFATSSIKYALSLNIGNPVGTNEFEGSLLENMVASTLFNLSNTDNLFNFNIFYDSNKNNNVDFLLNYGFENTIPIEVGCGKKDKRQVKNAMNRCNSNYGIVVSSKETMIKKDDDIIFIPLKTFSFL